MLDDNSTIYMCGSGNLIPSGMRRLISYVIDYLCSFSVLQFSFLDTMQDRPPEGVVKLARVKPHG